MRQVGPALRPGAKPDTTKAAKLRKRRAFSLFGRKKASHLRAEPPLVSAPSPIEEHAQPTPKSRRWALDVKALAKCFKPRLSKKTKSPDPAPSRAKYRWDRLMLRPRSRAAILRGAPTLAFTGLVCLLLTNVDLRRDISEAYNQLREDIVQRPELYVQVLEVTGASAKVDRQIRLSSGLSLPVSSFDMDLEAVKTRLEKLDAIQSVSVYLRGGGILQIDVEERTPVLLWRGPTGLESVDLDGVRTSYVDKRSDYPGLPLITGAGAKDDVEEALHLFRELRPIASNVRALRRVGKRRWDLVLDNDQIVKLPQERPGRALAFMLALQSSEDFLSRSVTVLDLRDPDRPVVRTGQVSKRSEVLVSTSVELQTESE